MSRRGRVCIYSEYLCPVLLPGTVPFAGGAETQLAHLSRGLLARGFDVTVVTCDFGQPSEVEFHGLRILRAFAPGAGVPIARFLHPRLTRTIAALRRADAEVYYVNGSGRAAGVTAEVARWRRAGFIDHCASDYDVTREGLLQHLGAHDRGWYLRAIRGADALLAQTEWQRAKFRDEFDLASEVLPNLVVLPERTSDPGAMGAVVWLGTYKAIKRPDWFVRLASDCPERRCIMAGVVPPPPLSREHWDLAIATAERIPNLEVRGFQDSHQVSELLRGASLLVHTSPVEGFSNVLLEAWAHGVPTASCVDPDGLVARERLGAVVTGYPDLLREVRGLLSDPAELRAAGQRARAYVARCHAPGAVIDQLAAVVDRVVAKVRSRRSR